MRPMLGLAIARALDEVDDVELVLGVRDVNAGKEVAASLGHRAKVVALDAGSRASVASLVQGWKTPRVLYG